MVEAGGALFASGSNQEVGAVIPDPRVPRRDPVESNPSAGGRVQPAADFLLLLPVVHQQVDSLAGCQQPHHLQEERLDSPHVSGPRFPVLGPGQPGGFVGMPTREA